MSHSGWEISFTNIEIFVDMPTKFAGRRPCRHPQIPGSGMPPSARGYSALRKQTSYTLNPKP